MGDSFADCERSRFRSEASRAAIFSAADILTQLLTLAEVDSWKNENAALQRAAPR